MNAINWMISKAQYEVLEDGTVTFFFEGTLPYRMTQEIKAIATSSKDNNSTVTYMGCDDLTGWGATFGAYKSTQTTVRFTFNDYTIPAGA